MEKRSFLSAKENYIFVIISLSISVYLLLRAIYVPIVFDEAATFFHFVHRGDFWFFNSLPDANNHFINSLLTRVSYSLFGAEKIFLRLPNLLSLPVFLYFVYKGSTYFNNLFLRWIFIASLIFSHFFIEFFALSRGYGLSMAFLLGAIYYLMTFSLNKNLRSLIWISVFITLAIYSNLSLIVLAISIIIFEMLIIIIHKEPLRNSTKKIAVIFVFQVIPLAFASYFMFWLNQKGSLYYGDKSGFWDLTIQSLILLLTGFKSTFLSLIFVIMVLYIIVVYSVKILKSGIISAFSSKLIWPGLLLLCSLGIFLLSLIFNINFPEDRVAMYFIPLFLGSLTFTADSMKLGALKKVGIIIASIMLLLPIHFLYSMNFSYVNGYKTEVLPEEFYDIVTRDDYNKSDFPPTIGGYRMRMFCWTYNNYMNNGTQNLINYQSYPEIESDFQIVDTDSFPQWNEKYEIIETEKILGRSLLKRKNRILYTPIDSVINNNSVVISDEYFRIAQWKLDTITNISLKVNAQLKLTTHSSPFNAWLVLAVIDSTNNYLQYKNIPFDWLRNEWKSDDNMFKHSLTTGVISDKAVSAKLFVWNIDKVNYSLDSLKITLLKPHQLN